MSTEFSIMRGATAFPLHRPPYAAMLYKDHLVYRHLRGCYILRTGKYRRSNVDLGRMQNLPTSSDRSANCR